MLNRIILFVTLLLQLGLFSSSAWAANIVVRTDRNPVGLNESFQLVYETEGDVGDPDFSVLDNQLDILNNTQSSNISIINGSYSSKKTWTLTVMAKQEGKLILPPVAFGSEKSPSYTLQVNKAAQNNAQQKDFFTRVRVSKSKVYVQQQLVVTQQLFSAYSLAAYGLGDIKFTGVDVVIEPLGDEKQYRTTVDGRAFAVVEKRFAVFPQQSGKLELQPVLVEGQTGSRSRSMFDPFTRGKIVRARSDKLDVEVTDVPPTADMSPWLPATDLQLMEQWAQSPPKFVQGEPVTRTISIKAEGLTAAQLPVLPDKAIDGFKQYPDQPLLDNIRNDSGLSGYRVEKVAFIPTRSGKITLPKIEIPWWNTKTQKRELAVIPEQTVDVAPAPASAHTTTALTPPDRAPVVTQPVKPKAETPILPVPVAGIASYWVWLAVFALLGWLATAVAWFLFARRRTRNNEEPISPVEQQQRSAFKQFVSSCESADATGCRSSLLHWAKLYFSDKTILSLSDLRAILPADVAQQLSLLDALLYGNAQQEVDYRLLVKAMQQFVKSHKHPSTQKEDLLQPLYK